MSSRGAVAALAAVVLASAPTRAAMCGSPPQGWGGAWWGAYIKWCRGCGGTICDVFDQCGGRCELPSAPAGAATAGGDPAEVLGKAIGDAVGTAIACKVFHQGCPPGAVNAENPQARAAYERMNRDRQAMIDQAMRDEDRRNEEKLDRIRSALDAGSGGLKPHDLSEQHDPDLEEVKGAFGSNEIKVTGDAVSRAQVHDTASLSPLQQLRCAGGLMNTVADLSNDLDLIDRMALSEDAANYLQGMPARADCAKPSPLPSVATPRSVALERQRTLEESRSFSGALRDQIDLVKIAHDLETAQGAAKQALLEQKAAKEADLGRKGQAYARARANKVRP